MGNCCCAPIPARIEFQGVSAVHEAGPVHVDEEGRGRGPRRIREDHSVAWPRAKSKDATSRLTVALSAKCAGRVIGRGGEHVKRIQSLSGAQVNIDSKRGVAHVEISGGTPWESLQACMGVLYYAALDKSACEVSIPLHSGVWTRAGTALVGSLQHNGEVAGLPLRSLVSGAGIVSGEAVRQGSGVSCLWIEARSPARMAVAMAAIGAAVLSEEGGEPSFEARVFTTDVRSFGRLRRFRDDAAVIVADVLENARWGSTAPCLVAGESKAIRAGATHSVTAHETLTVPTLPLEAAGPKPVALASGGGSTPGLSYAAVAGSHAGLAGSHAGVAGSHAGVAGSHAGVAAAHSSEAVTHAKRGTAVFFSPSPHPEEHSLPEAMKWVIKVIESARTSLDIAVYSLTDNSFREAILGCHKRGVRVRLLADEEQTRTPGSDVAWLRGKGVEVRTTGSPEHLFHHKFIVIDGVAALTGSLNLTRQASRMNWENVILLEGGDIAREFTTEFERLWESSLGPLEPLKLAPLDTRAPLIRPREREGAPGASGSSDGVEHPFEWDESEAVMFPCGPGGNARLCEYIASARTSVIVAALAITSDDVRRALLGVHKRGTQVQILADWDKSDEAGSDVGWLRSKGVPVRTVRAEGSMLHHKFLVLDHSLVLTGSFNFTRSASERNFENILVVRSNGCAEAFEDEFGRLWQQFS
jgi:phosphatidylserine/phosphatidylglycerophosphate/cardiolipin synthase-like enzyme